MTDYLWYFIALCLFFALGASITATAQKMHKEVTLSPNEWRCTIWDKDGNCLNYVKKGLSTQ